MAIIPDVLDPEASYVLGGSKYEAFLRSLVADTSFARTRINPEEAKYDFSIPKRLVSHRDQKAQDPKQTVRDERHVLDPVTMSQ
jgi:hypothetical protein